MECLLRRNLETARSLGTEEKAMAFARELMGNFLSAPAGVSTPYFAPATADLFQKYYGLDPDRFRQEKIDSNRFVLDRLDGIRSRVEAAEDPVYAGLQFAILGNYIDFSALGGEVSFEVLDDLLHRGEQYVLDQAAYRRFCADMDSAKTLLYITDNAGEIGFDRVLAEQIHLRWPSVAITFCVRGGPAMNDATREDARAVGITFPVIDSGSRINGMEIPYIGQEARSALESADVVIAKGQGNTETMLGCGYNVYYAFLVKCRRFTAQFGKPKLTPMFLRERDVTE